MKYILPLILVLFSVNIKVLFAQSQSINATVKINVCGDGVAEGEEECDTGDFKTQTCDSLGLGGGALQCSIACDLDRTGCSATPAPTASPESTGASSGSSTAVSEQITQVVTNFITQLRETVTEIVKRLPVSLGYFDLDGNGKIDVSRLQETVGLWISEIKKTPISERKCDVNGDKKCDLLDFSILMYHVE